MAAGGQARKELIFSLGFRNSAETIERTLQEDDTILVRNEGSLEALNPVNSKCHSKKEGETKEVRMGDTESNLQLSPCQEIVQISLQCLHEEKEEEGI